MMRVAPRPERQVIHFPHPKGRDARDYSRNQRVPRRRRNYRGESNAASIMFDVFTYPVPHVA